MTTMDYAKFMESVRAREGEIAGLRKKGFTLVEIGDKYNISVQRVHQILERQKKERKKNPALKKPEGAH